MTATASRRRIAAALATVIVSPLLLLGAAGPGNPSAARAAADDDGRTASAVTVTGRPGTWGEDYSNLRITVSQTRDLTAQGVTVTWSGGAPTGLNQFVGKNYLQFMQCWGADPGASDFRETCQYGKGVVPENSRQAIGLGHSNNSRFVGKSSLVKPDPAEELQKPEAGGARSVPFRAVDGTRTPDGGKNNPYPRAGADGLADYFSEHTTNEIPYARTTRDGTGRITFEVQTVAEAPGLGCGQPVRSGATVVGRPCWLVIVPRGSHDAQGREVTGNPAGTVLDGSPLSRSFFANRIAVRLEFQPVDVLCPQGKDERPTIGTELVEPAVLSWQPLLCADNGPVFGFTTAGDGEANEFLRGSNDGGPGLAFVTDAPEPAPGAPAVLHAPVALGAAVVAMQIETKVNPGSGDAVERLRGTPVRDLKLTPRLVAKLLTQSYKADVPDGNNRDYLGAKNWRSIRNDPEFLELNPLFDNFAASAKPDGVMVTVGSSALAREVWEWILADPDAVRWLAGRADENGMVVNKHYLPFFSSDQVPDSFPKEDPSCVQPPEATVPNPVQDPADPNDDRIPMPWCTLGLRPYVGSLREAAVQALRGDAKVRITWDATTLQPGYKVSPPQPVGERFSLAITDATAAARYGLATASLRNRRGEFVAPTAAGLRSAVDAMTAGRVPGVLQNNPRRAVAGGYPLTMLTYAAVKADQPAAARADYARLLRYAVGPGQHPGTARGQLPAGYLPLPTALRQHSEAVAAVLERRDPGPGVPATAVPGAGRSAGATAAAKATPTATVAAKPSGVPAAGSSVPPLPTAAAGSGAPEPAVAVSLATAGRPLGTIRFLLVAVLVVGVVSGISGPLMLTLGYRRRATGDRQ